MSNMNSKSIMSEKSIKYVGCCGTFCKTCKPFIDGFCKGCRLGYENRKRDINKARCKIKLCCMKEKKLETCADCTEFSSCEKINTRFGKEKYNLKKCMQSLDFIKKNGYPKFIKKAEKWKSYWGKLE